MTTKVMFLHDQITGRGVGCIATMKSGDGTQLLIGYSACAPEDKFVKADAMRIAEDRLAASPLSVPFTPQDTAFTLRTKTLTKLVRARTPTAFRRICQELLAQDNFLRRRRARAEASML
jgi:hypothetical protein